MKELPSDRIYIPERKRDDPYAGSSSEWIASIGGWAPRYAIDSYVGGSAYGVDEIGPFVDRVIDHHLVPGTEKWITRYRPEYLRHYFGDQEKAARLIGQLITRRAAQNTQ